MTVDLGEYDLTPRPAPIAWWRWLVLVFLDEPVPPCPPGLRRLGRVLGVLLRLWAALVMLLYGLSAWQWHRWLGLGLYACGFVGLVALCLGMMFLERQAIARSRIERPEPPARRSDASR
jgi:hypothetical protein